jgi:hypothetical protein
MAQFSKSQTNDTLKQKQRQAIKIVELSLGTSISSIVVTTNAKELKS